MKNNGNPTEPPKFYLNPGYIFVSMDEHFINTVLGSCVSVCIWDEVRKAGGMNHYIFNKCSGEKNTRYGDVSTKHLIRLMLDMGCSIGNLKSHIVGGAKNPELNSCIGEENVKTAAEILEKAGIEIVSRDIGGFTGRKVIFNSRSGELLVYKGVNIRKNDWY